MRGYDHKLRLLLERALLELKRIAQQGQDPPPSVLPNITRRNIPMKMELDQFIYFFTHTYTHISLALFSQDPPPRTGRMRSRRLSSKESRSGGCCFSFHERFSLIVTNCDAVLSVCLCSVRCLTTRTISSGSPTTTVSMDRCFVWRSLGAKMSTFMQYMFFATELCCVMCCVMRCKVEQR